MQEISSEENIALIKSHIRLAPNFLRAIFVFCLAFHLCATFKVFWSIFFWPTLSASLKAKKLKDTSFQLLYVMPYFPLLEYFDKELLLINM